MDNRPIKTIGTYYHRMYNGGIEHIQAELIDLWISMGYQVVLYTAEPENPQDFDYDHSVKHVVISNTDYDLRLRQLKESFIEDQVDCFVEHNWACGCMEEEIGLAHSLGVKYILYVHGHYTALYTYYVTDFALESLRVFRKCDAVITLSSLNKRFYDMIGCRAYQMMNPVPGELKCIENKKRPHNKHMLWIGRIDDGKRIEEALEIFALVLKQVPDAYLDVVGTGPKHYIKLINKMAKELNIVEHVKFHGYQKEVAHFYDEADVLLFTSEKEGSPVTLLESRAHALPVVMYDLSYLEIVKDNLGVRKLPLGNVDAMAASAIDILLDDVKIDILSDEANQSFQMVLDYPIKDKWRELLKQLEEDDFYLCPKEKDEDMQMWDFLLAELKKGISFNTVHNIDYQVGNKLLKIPRKLLGR